MDNADSDEMRKAEEVVINIESIDLNKMILGDEKMGQPSVDHLPTDDGQESSVQGEHTSVEGSEERLCPICLEKMDATSKKFEGSCPAHQDVSPSEFADTKSKKSLLTTPCGHTFHERCLQANVAHDEENERIPICPLCRTPIEALACRTRSESRESYWERQRLAFVHAAYNHRLERRQAQEVSRLRSEDMLWHLSEEGENDWSRSTGCLHQNRTPLSALLAVVIALVISLVVAHFVSPRGI